MNIINILLVSISVVTASLSFIIIRGEKRTSNRVFSSFILAISFWAFGIFLFRFSSSVHYSLIFSNFNYFIAAVIAAIFLHFSLIFPKERKLKIYEIYIIYFPPIIILLGCIMQPHLILQGIYFSEPNLKLVAINSLGYWLYTSYFIFCLIVAYVNLFRSWYISSDISVKIQLKFIIMGTLVPYLFAMYTDLIWASFNYKFVWIGPFFAIMVVYVILYAVYRYHLLNTEVVAAEILTASLWIFILVRTLLSNSNRELWINITLLALATFVGILLLRSVWREINMRKQAEQLSCKLEKTNSIIISLNSSLNQKVAEQTGEIRQALESEKKARQELEKLNDAKDQFIMITQHHLRTPVTSILWGLESLLKDEYGKLGNEPQTVLAEMRTSCKRLMKIVDDFLNITAIKVGTNILNLRLGSLETAIDEILQELKSEIKNKNISVNFTSNCNTWPMLKLDHDKMRETLFIIIENAVRYNHFGGEMTISSRTNGDTFELIVKNTGIGITKDEASKIGSSLFYRGEEAKQNNPIGMGIGLSVAKAIIRAHRGTFNIESNGKNEGATVIIKLPKP